MPDGVPADCDMPDGVPADCDMPDGVPADCDMPDGVPADCDAVSCRARCRYALWLLAPFGMCAVRHSRCLASAHSGIWRRTALTPFPCRAPFSCCAPFGLSP